MKKILLSIFLALVLNLQAQIQKAETYIIGTKVDYYLNQCANIPPEAAGKFTFCDTNNNLGVVAESYGLNGVSIWQMAPNYHNNDEVYVTKEGLSIKHDNGSWENIPDYAVQPVSSNPVSFLSSLVLPGGKTLIQISNNNWSFEVYNQVQKTMENIEIPTHKNILKFLFDTDNNYAIIFTGNSTNYDIYSYDGSQLNLLAANINQANNGIPGNLISNNRPAVYNNHKIYAASNWGLYIIDISDMSNITTTHYDTTTTPALPYDNVRDLDFDNQGNLWMITYLNSEGAVSKWDFTTNSLTNYQETVPAGSGNLVFNDLAVKDAQNIWLIPGNYNGLVNLDASSGTPVWNFVAHTDIENAGFYYNLAPKAVQYFNNRFYFTFFNGSSSEVNSEVLIYANGTWSDRNDNAPGNISWYMVNRFNFIQPDDIGGVWWFNESDDMVLYKDAQDNFKYENLNFTNTGVIDADQKAVVRTSTQTLTKIDMPGTHDFAIPANNANYLNRIDNEIWSFSSAQPRIDIIENEVVTNTFIMDETSYQNSFYQFAVDDNRNAWFAKVSGNNLQIKKFDTQTLTTTTIDYPTTTYPGAITKILAAPNNAIWIVNRKAIFYVSNATVTPFYQADHPEINNIYDAVVDENGKLYFVNLFIGSSAGGSLVSLENPLNNPVIDETVLCGHNSYNPIFPEFINHNITNLCIDSEGDVWVFAPGKGAFIKLIDNDTTVQYRHQPTLSITDLSGNGIQLKVYPNPVGQVLHINAGESLSHIALYTMSGRLIWQINPDIKHVEVPTRQLVKGIYILKITSGTKQVIKQIIKN